MSPGRLCHCPNTSYHLRPVVVTATTAAGPSPASLYAFTVKEYEIPGCKPVTVKLWN